MSAEQGRCSWVYQLSWIDFGLVCKETWHQGVVLIEEETLPTGQLWALFINCCFQSVQLGIALSNHRQKCCPLAFLLHCEIFEHLIDPRIQVCSNALNCSYESQSTSAMSRSVRMVFNQRFDLLIVNDFRLVRTYSVFQVKTSIFKPSGSLTNISFSDGIISTTSTYLLFSVYVEVYVPKINDHQMVKVHFIYVHFYLICKRLTSRKKINQSNHFIFNVTKKSCLITKSRFQTPPIETCYNIFIQTNIFTFRPLYCCQNHYVLRFYFIIRNSVC